MPPEGSASGITSILPEFLPYPTAVKKNLQYSSSSHFQRGRHLMDDLFRMMPHAKTDSKMQKKESLFAVNEIAEMKNCSRVLLVEGRRKRDVFLWAGIVARGPSVKFEVGKQTRRMLLRLKRYL